MVRPGESESLAEFSGPGAKVGQNLPLPAFPHGLESNARFQGAEKHETVSVGALDEEVEHPVDAIVEVDVGNPSGMILDELTRGRANRGVTGGVSLR
jgi:hypothetical protein